jgi:hypothetical protein
MRVAMRLVGLDHLCYTRQAPAPHAAAGSSRRDAERLCCLAQGGAEGMDGISRTPVELAASTASELGGAGERHIALLDRSAWRYAAVIWLLSHVLVVGVTYFGRVLVLIPSYSTQRLSWGSMVSPWLAWDGNIYATIASEGYSRFWMTRFFPLLPAAEHVVAVVTGGNTALAGLLISNLATLPAFALFTILVERETDRATARRALLYFAFFPTALFFVAAYAESLYVLFAVACFLALRRGNWLAAGALAAVATLARPVGILLVVPIATEAWLRMRQAQRMPSPGALTHRLAGLALPVAALAGFSLYLAQRYGTLTAVVTSQNADGAAGSGKGFTWPWVGFLRAGRALVQNGAAPNFFQVHIVLDAAFTLLLIGLTVATYRRLPLPYVLYCWAVLVLLICTPGHNWYALYSNMRFILEVFPLFILLAKWGEKQMVDRVVLGVSLPLMTLLTLAFALFQWVA